MSDGRADGQRGKRGRRGNYDPQPLVINIRPDQRALLEELGRLVPPMFTTADIVRTMIDLAAPMVKKRPETVAERVAAGVVISAKSA